MGIFTTLQTDPFADLSNTPTTILTAVGHTIQVNNVIVTNVTNGNIQFNLLRIVTPNEGEPFTTEIVINRLIKSPYNRRNGNPVDTVINDIPYFIGNNPEGSTDELICYSNGEAQKFNVQISYTILNETPFGGAC
jgi:hypothetical protein